MQLFTQQINNLQDQINKLQAEQLKLQSIEQHSTDGIELLKLALLELNDDNAFAERGVSFIATLKNAVMDLFPHVEPEELEPEEAVSDSQEISPVAVEDGEDETDQVGIGSGFGLTLHNVITVNEEGGVTVVDDVEDEVDEPKDVYLNYTFETAELAERFVADNIELAEVFTCDGVEVKVKNPEKPVDCFDNLAAQYIETTQEVSEYVPSNSSLIQINDRVRFDSSTNTLSIWFRIKKDIKPWARQYEFSVPDAYLETVKDDSIAGFKYRLDITRLSNEDYTDWALEQAKMDFSKTPEENRKALESKPAEPVEKIDLPAEKFHLLIQSDPAEIVQLEGLSLLGAIANFNQYTQSCPPHPVNLMSDTKGCVESYLPPVLSFLATGIPSQFEVRYDTQIEGTTYSRILGFVYEGEKGWTVDDEQEIFSTREEAANTFFNRDLSPAVQQNDTPNESLTEEATEVVEEPIFTFVATGYGAMRVIKDSEVIGMVWPDAGKWTLEDGQAFNTQEEAVNALFYTTPSVA